MRCDLESMELLLAITDKGSIGQAARALQLSQPTVTARLRKLERQLGLDLVERSPRGSRPTEDGLAVSAWAREVLAASDRFEANANALRHRQSSQLNVVASLTIAEYLMPWWLTGLRAEEPDLAVSLRVRNSVEVAAELRAGTADLGFVEGVESPPDLESRVIAHDRLAVVVAAAHPWARLTRPVTVDELLSTTLVLREVGSGTRETFERALHEGGRVIGPVIELGSTAAIKATLASSACAAILSKLAVHDDIGAGVLLALDVNGLDLRRRLRAVWRKDRPPRGPAARLVRRAQTHPWPKPADRPGDPGARSGLVD